MQHNRVSSIRRLNQNADRLPLRDRIALAVNKIILFVERLGQPKMESLQPLPGQELEQIREATLQPEQLTLSLSKCRAFMKLPLSERRQILAKQAEEMLEHYKNSPEWRELQAGDIIDY